MTLWWPAARPEEIAPVEASYAGQYLRQVLDRKRTAATEAAE